MAVVVEGELKSILEVADVAIELVVVLMVDVGKSFCCARTRVDLVMPASTPKCCMTCVG